MKVEAEVFPVVYITPRAKQRLDLYIKLCDTEISGLGKAERTESGDFLITDVRIFEQEVTVGSTDLDPDVMQKFLLELVETGENPEEWKLWWHSHGNGGTFWSKTDETTARNFDNGWMISVVGNRRGEYRCRVDLFSPVKITLDEIDFRVKDEAPAELIEEIFTDITEKVTERKIPTKRYDDYSEYAGVHGIWGYGRRLISEISDRREPERPSEEHRVRPFLGTHDSDKVRGNIRGSDERPGPVIHVKGKVK